MKTVIKKVFAIIIATTSHLTLSAQNDDNAARIDSLITEMHEKQEGSIERLKTIEQIAFEHYNVDSTIAYAQMEIDLAMKLREPYYEGKAYNYMAWGYHNRGNYVKACEYASQAIIAAKKAEDKETEAKGYYHTGNAYAMMKNATASDEAYNKALMLYTELEDDASICQVLKNMASTNIEYDMLDIAEDYLNRAIEIERLNGDKESLSEDYCLLSLVSQKRYENTLLTNPESKFIHNALRHTQTARKLAQETGPGYYLMRCDIRLAELMLTASTTDDPTMSPKRAQEMKDSCKTLIDEAYIICDKRGLENDKLSVHSAYSNWLIADKQYAKAEAFMDSLQVVYERNSQDHIDDMLGLFKSFEALYYAKEDYLNAYIAQNKYQELYTQSLKMDYAAKSAQSIAELQYEKQMRQREIEYETESRVRRWAIYSISAILVLALALAVTSIRSYLRSRKDNLALDEKNNELEQQKEEILLQNEMLEQQNEQIERQSKDLKEQNKQISEANREMTDSINYAKAIQEAALPSKGQIDSIFGQTLVVFRPLNIVSGDFYWVQQVGDLKMLAVGDCTGHGVPGAFLSMLGISILNDIAAHYNPANVSAGAVLDKMRDTFIQALHQRGENMSNQDGIDLALIIINAPEQKMHYAGAYRPIVFVRDGEAKKLEHDKMPIGSHHREKEHFTDNCIDLQTGDVIYLFTDGMTDQFGYDSNKEMHKFGTKKLIPLLRDISRLPMSTQKMKIEMTIDNWRMNAEASDTPYEQTDDALIVGIRV